LRLCVGYFCRIHLIGLFDSAPGQWQRCLSCQEGYTKSRRTGQRAKKSPASLLGPERRGFAAVPAIRALRREPTRDTVLAPIQWGDQHSFRDIVAGYASAGLHCDFPTRLRAKKVAWAVYLTKVR